MPLKIKYIFFTDLLIHQPIFLVQREKFEAQQITQKSSISTSW